MNLRNAISILVIVFLIGFISQKSIKNYYPHNDFAETKNGIQLLILPEYETYYLGQSVWVKVKLINRSDKKLMLKYPIASMYFDFVIKDYERNVLPKGWIACDTHPENDTAFLAPHKDTTFIFSLVMFFPGGETMNESTNGVYTISTSFNGISSNEAEINFINPVGKEKEIRNQYYNSKIHSDITDGINDYKLVFNQNPTSRFIPQYFNKVLVESFHTLMNQ